MQPDPTRAERVNVPPQVVWDHIVQVTSSIGSDEAKALRVWLHIAFLGDSAVKLRAVLGYYRKLWRWLGVPIRRTVPGATTGRPLFASIFGTPSNTHNLLPVLQAARERHWQPNLLLGDTVDVDSMGLSGMENVINATRLMAVTTVRERITALAGARKDFAELRFGFERLQPQWVKTIERNRTPILAELALFKTVRHGLRRLYAEWEPSCVISTSDLWPFEHAVFAEAGRLGIPSFVIQHGVVGPFWWPCVAEKLLLWGNSFESELRELGVPAERLDVCGMPAADRLFGRYRGDPVRASGEPASSYVILSDAHAQGLYPEIYASYKILLKAVVAATPEIRWSVKLHPIEDDRFYRDMLDGRFPNFDILPKSTTLEDAVTRADAACTLWSSTAGLEAMMMRRPLIVFDVAPMIRECAWWPKRGGGTYVPSAEAMINFVRKASADARFLADLVRVQDEFLARNFSNPGRAAEAVLESVEKVITRVPEDAATEDLCNGRA